MRSLLRSACSKARTRRRNEAAGSPLDGELTLRKWTSYSASYCRAVWQLFLQRCSRMVAGGADGVARDHWLQRERRRSGRCSPPRSINGSELSCRASALADFLDLLPNSHHRCSHSWEGPPSRQG